MAILMAISQFAIREVLEEKFGDLNKLQISNGRHFTIESVTHKIDR